MQLISCHDGRLLKLDAQSLGGARTRLFRTGLEALDAIAPGGAFACGAVHELLSEPAHGKPLFLAMVMARSMSGTRIIWCDTHNELYPPALAAHGIPLEQLFLLHPKPADQTWAIAECLRCKGVGVVIATIPRLSRIEARRLQLAAETGGGVGIFLRPAGPGNDIYAAATRWLVKPAPPERTIQRWAIQLIHGHGGRLGHTVTLEHCRENNLVRTTVELADRSNEKAWPSRFARAS